MPAKVERVAGPLAGALGPQPRIVLPLAAALAAAVAIERMGAPWFVGCAVFCILAVLAFGLAMSARRNRVEWIRLASGGDSEVERPDD